MKFNHFWLLLSIIISGYSHGMENDIQIIKTKGKLWYKCLLCNYRPVAHQATMATHWSHKHSTQSNMLIKEWKKNFFECMHCGSHHPNYEALRQHLYRQHYQENASKHLVAKTITKHKRAISATIISQEEEDFAPHILLELSNSSISINAQS